jgi:hypothetical protein
MLTEYALQLCADNGYEGFVTNVDVRLSDVKEYIDAGYEIVKETSPKSWYADRHNRFNGNDLKRNAIGLTSAYFASLAGMSRIWGTSALVMQVNANK